MATILVATDFSTRSDRAVRRAELLAVQSGAELLLVHVIDDDQPERMIRAAYREAEALLMDLRSTLLELSGVRAGFQLCKGSTFEEVPAAASEAEADLIVMGPHRPQILLDTFRGVTIERTVQKSSLPVLIANGVPASNHRRLLHAVTLDDTSAQMTLAAREGPYFTIAETVLLHVYDSLARMSDARSMTPGDGGDNEAAAEARDHQLALTEFAQLGGIEADKLVVRPSSGSAGTDILSAAAEEGADLVVIGRSSKGLIEAAFTGRASTVVLRQAERDVLVMPC